MTRRDETSTTRKRMGWVVILLLVTLIATACGGGDDDDSDPDGAATDRTTTTSSESNDETSGRAADDAPDPWRANAMPNRDRVGQTFTLDCPPKGQPGSIWGVETYTADSSICTAAVHVGLITFDDGGEVTYEIAAGLDEYESATANEVLSSRFGRFDGSFTFPDAPPGSGDFVLGAETWQRKATEYRAKTGQEFTLECASGGPVGSVWGTDTYTDDSSICTAAVHAGLITLAKGGTVTIEISAGRDTYEGTAANGVTSADYGAYEGSFTFPDDQPDQD